MDPFDSLGGHYGLQTASEVRSDLRVEISDLNYLHIHVHIAYMFWTHFEGFLVASEATTASKRPRRSDLTSDFEFVAQIAHATMLSAKSALKQLRKSTFWTLVAPPGGQFGRHLVAR